MNPERMQIKLAECAGWMKHPTVPNCWRTPETCESNRKLLGVVTGPWNIGHPGPPNYPSDLNAVHELEDALPSELRHGENSYASWLWKITAHSVEGGSTWYVIHATALQRCEALLRTLNLWEEE